MISSESPAAPQATHRRWWLGAIVACMAGLVTALLGFVLAGLGMGFANATASGTGMAAVLVGLWTVLAAKGIAWGRRATYLGLSLGWLWLLIRIIWDWPATASSGIVLLLLVPALSVPLVAVWLVLVTVAGLAGAVRSWRMIRRGRPSAPEDRQRTRSRTAIGLAVRLTVLVAVTLLVPRLVWQDRGQKLQALAEQYASGPQQAGQAPVLGACSMVFLGYELTQHAPAGQGREAAREAAYASALRDVNAELASFVQAGSKYVRVGASGDQLVEDKPDQERVDDQYVHQIRDTGISLVLVDTQHPQAFRDRKLGWDEFCRFQQERIAYYQQRYRPQVYFVVCEPLSYHAFILAKDVAFSAEAWAHQLAAMCRLVKSLDAGTQTGICLLVTDDHQDEWDVWTRMKTLPELDILSVEIYEPKNFPQTQQRLAEYGHPRETGKRFWIAETYNGWALCGQRDWDQDAAWLRLTSRFAGVVQADTVLVWSFGTFVPGGSYWDFGRGELAERWKVHRELSVVGRTFAELQSP